MSDTPETDAAVVAAGGDWSPVLRAVAQRLERQRDEAREALKFRRELYKFQEQCLETERRERDEAREALMEIESVYVDGCDTCADRERMGSIARAALAFHTTLQKVK
jgi:hypothetical protein